LIARREQVEPCLIKDSSTISRRVAKMARTMARHRTTVSVQRYLEQLERADGDHECDPVVHALIERSADRLHMLCRSMLHKKYPRLLKGPSNLESEDLLSGLVERMIKALQKVRPKTTRQYFALASQHLRWELNELSRRLDGRIYELELRESQGLPAPLTTDGDRPGRLSLILEAIDRLPDEEREAFNLVRVQGVPMAEAAAIVGVSLSTLKRRVNRSVDLLAEMLGELDAQ
jgi:RNA polymerase sigma-70 factor (ECF subfamily)